MGYLTARPTPAGRAGRADKGVSAPFGYSPQYNGGKSYHHGTDYYWLNADVAGSRKVYAAGAGKVTKIIWDATLGQCITIDHGDFLTRYCHMPKNSAAVAVGQQVTDETYLGPMGNAGTAANGAYHLHHEAWKDDARVDPEPFYRVPPVIVTPKDNQRQAKATASVNLRAARDPLAVKVGSIAAGAIVTPLGWRRGVAHQGIDTWLLIAVDNKGVESWAWLGGFTKQTVDGLADLTPPPVVEPEPAPAEVEPPTPIEPEPELPVDPEPIIPEPEPEPQPAPVEPPLEPEAPGAPRWGGIAALIGIIVTAILAVLGISQI